MRIGGFFFINMNFIKKGDNVEDVDNGKVNSTHRQEGGKG